MVEIMLEAICQEKRQWNPDSASIFLGMEGRQPRK
jgi:hypothetical protein